MIQLTNEQIQQMYVFRNRYVHQILSSINYPEGIRNTTCLDVEAGVKEVYKRSNLPWPKLILIAHSYREEKYMIDFTLKFGTDYIFNESKSNKLFQQIYRKMIASSAPPAEVVVDTPTRLQHQKEDDFGGGSGAPFQTKKVYPS